MKAVVVFCVGDAPSERPYDTKTPYCTICGALGGPERTKARAAEIEQTHAQTEH